MSDNVILQSSLRIPYEDFLRQYSIVLRGQDQRSRSQLGVTSDPDDPSENKENELLFDPLEELYKKQLKMTPKRKSTTPKRRLRRRAGKSFKKSIYLLNYLFIYLFIYWVIQNCLCFISKITPVIITDVHFLIAWEISSKIFTVVNFK